MANSNYMPGVYRSSGGDQMEVVSSGRIAIDAGGEIDVLAGGRLEIAGVPLISSGGLVDLSSAIGKAGVFSTGTGQFAAVTSTGTGTFNAVSSTGTITGNAVSSTGTGTFNAVNSTGSINAAAGFVSTGGSITSTGSGVAAKFDAVTSTGTGTFAAVSSTGTGTFNAVSSTGTGTFNGVSSTGIVTANNLRVTAGYVDNSFEAITSGSTDIRPYGISFVTAATALTMPLQAPVANQMKWISAISTAATLLITSSSAGASIGGSTQISISSGTLATPAWVNLIGENSTNWRVLGFSTAVSII
ncbi:MAG: hypothetical protein Q7K03_08380 [Dehalococcoidia bacterium]|nr:hypothetical protein [Dehalococcoidia bacterium]